MVAWVKLGVTIKIQLVGSTVLIWWQKFPVILGSSIGQDSVNICRRYRLSHFSADSSAELAAASSLWIHTPILWARAFVNFSLVYDRMMILTTLLALLPSAWTRDRMNWRHECVHRLTAGWYAGAAERRSRALHMLRKFYGVLQLVTVTIIFFWEFRVKVSSSIKNTHFESQTLYWHSITFFRTLHVDHFVEPSSNCGLQSVPNFVFLYGLLFNCQRWRIQHNRLQHSFSTGQWWIGWLSPSRIIREIVTPIMLLFQVARTMLQTASATSLTATCRRKPYHWLLEESRKSDGH